MSSRRSSGGDATLSETFPVSRQPRKCFGCEGRIAKGERYRRWKGVSSDVAPGVLTYVECARCCARYGRPLTVPAGPTDKEKQDG